MTLEEKDQIVACYLDQIQAQEHYSSIEEEAKRTVDLLINDKFIQKIYANF